MNTIQIPVPNAKSSASRVTISGEGIGNHLVVHHGFLAPDPGATEWRIDPKTWAITHLPTMAYVGRGFTRKKDAMECANECIATGADLSVIEGWRISRDHARAMIDSRERHGGY